MVKKPTIPIKFKTSAGYSLLEVFIAIVISLILLAGILQVFLNSKVNYNLTTANAQLQESGRFIEAYIVRAIRLAGYRSLPAQGSQFIPAANVFTTALPFVSGTYGTGPNNSDTLVVRYQGSGDGAGNPDGTVVDCLNVPADANTMITNTYSLTNNFELQCRALNANSPNPNNTQILLYGVENFKVLFGEDLSGNYTASRYVNANFPFLTLADVVSIRLSLLLRSNSPVNPYSRNPTFNLLGTSYTPASSDKYLRTQFTVTVLLRNMIIRPF